MRALLVGAISCSTIVKDRTFVVQSFCATVRQPIMNDCYLLMTTACELLKSCDWELSSAVS